MNWRGKNDIVPAGIVAFVAVVAMWRDTMIDQPGIAMTLAALVSVGVALWWPKSVR